MTIVSLAILVVVVPLMFIFFRSKPEDAQDKIEIEGSVRDVIESLYKNQDSFLHQNSAYLKLAKFISNGVKKSKENAQYHYDIGNDFYRLWLDDTLTYSCAYFKSPEDTLVQAQKDKVDHILRKLNLQEGQRLLDIGCGWGELIFAAAQKYHVFKNEVFRMKK